jgi:hypothetical protein
MPQSKWYYHHDGQTGGPVSVAQLQQLAADGLLLPTDRVRKEDMDRWVKARAVKGLFTPAELPPPASPEPAGGEITFDFLGAGPPEAANEFHPAFDFFGAPPSPPPAQAEGQESAAAPARKSNPPPKSKPVQPLAADFPVAAAVEDGSSVPVAAPVKFPHEDSVPYADVPMAMPASDIGPPAPSVSMELTGPEVTVQPDGSARPTGGALELSVTGGWLMAKSAAADGSVGETYLRLRHLAAVTLRDRPGAGLVLSFHAGAEVVAMQVDGDAEAARAFMRRVLEAAG